MAAFADRYRVQRELGRGGMAIVFLAEDPKHGRLVALKVLRPELAATIGTQRFLREIRIAASLSHPNILTLIDSGESGGFLYYVMPYVEGETLRGRLQRERQLPLDDTLRIARELAEALSYAHGQSIVHRDIKPENVLFTAGHAVLADFGMASAVGGAGAEQLTEAGLAVGTPVYMSPEQAAGAAVDARSDIYSLGCVVYEMLAGVPPFTGVTPQAILARKALESVPSLRVVRDTVPPAVEAAIMRALAKVPTDRFATAGELAAALSPERLARPKRGGAARRTWNRWGGVLALAAVLLVAGAFIQYWRSGNDAAPMSVATVTPLTSAPGVEWFPSFSPDGKWLVYSAEGTSKSGAAVGRDIFLMSLTGKTPLDITPESPGDDHQPAFSPDGEKIAFRSSRDGGGIFIMGRTGEAVTRLTRFGYSPTWDPQGTRIAFAKERVELDPQNSDARSTLWIADVKSGAAREIEVHDGVLPAWSPHGNRIAFSTRLGRPAQMDVWTIAPDGSGATPVTDDAAIDWFPRWSPDGKYLYFVSNRGGTMNLWRIEIDERSGKARGEPEPITTPATSVAHLAVSADNRQIVYSAASVTQNVDKLAFDVATATVQGEPIEVTSGSRRWSDPMPSPDGQRIVAYSHPDEHISIIATDGTGARQLTADSASGDRVPHWSPDGSWIAFFSNRPLSGRRLFQVWKIRPDGSELQPLTDAPEGAAVPIWSPDGSRIAASGIGPRGRVVLIDPNRRWAAQTGERLPPPPSALSPFGPTSWSFDGKRLAGTISYGDSGIVVYSFDTGSYDRLTTFGQWPVWLPDNRRILFVSGGKTFYVVDRESRQVRKVYTASRGVIGPPQLSRNGRFLYFSRRATEADLFLVRLR